MRSRLALALSACTYVERDRPVPAQPAAVTTVPAPPRTNAATTTPPT